MAFLLNKNSLIRTVLQEHNCLYVPFVYSLSYTSDSYCYRWIWIERGTLIGKKFTSSPLFVLFCFAKLDPAVSLKSITNIVKILIEILTLLVKSTKYKFSKRTRSNLHSVITEVHTSVIAVEKSENCSVGTGVSKKTLNPNLYSNNTLFSSIWMGRDVNDTSP